MSNTAIYIRLRAQPGKREEIRRVWEKHAKPRAAANPAHTAYYFCYDRKDPNLLSVFQVYNDPKGVKGFLEGDWYAAYQKEIRPLIAAQPRISVADVMWEKAPA